MTYGKTLRTQIAARSTDPETSKEAAASLDTQSLVETCYDLLRSAGSRGMTASEMAARIGVDRDSVSPRLPRLKQEYGVHDSGERRASQKGRKQTVWVVEGARRRKKMTGSKPVKFRGEVVGEVKRGVFYFPPRDAKDVYLHGCKTIAEALDGRGAWVFDLKFIEGLLEAGVLTIEVPTRFNWRYRTKTELILGSQGFDITTGEHPQVALELKYWTRLDT